METLPIPLQTLDDLAAARGGLTDFRLTSEAELAAVFKQLRDANVALHLNASNGHAVAVTVWATDAARGILSFNTEAATPQLQALVDCDEAVVVGYLDSVKLQFDATQLVLVHSGNATALNCAYPREVFRFQRRSAFRVRPLMRSAPTARLRHPMIRDMLLKLRILDMSIGGCALFLPNDEPPLPPGAVLERVRIDLDADTRFFVDLRLHHVTSINADAKGVRLGCEFVRADGNVQRTLQRFIDLTQKRGKLLALS